MGARRVAVIDPGPVSDAHLAALVEALRDAESASVMVTHGHPDHAPGAHPLARALQAAGVAGEVLGPPGVEGIPRPLVDGDVVPTDAGELVAVETPGHAHDHLAFHWPARSAVFVGDLLLGRGDTVWVGEYGAAVADYLRSLERVRALDARILYPAHGPPLTNPSEALDRFAAHRHERIRQMESALAAHPDAGAEELLELVYGTALPSGVRQAVLMSLEALKAHVERSRGDA